MEAYNNEWQKENAIVVNLMLKWKIIRKMHQKTSYLSVKRSERRKDGKNANT